uniref:GPR180/TMEM145 transmembrane domain-containing protein n=2 Tax=Lutzomyia longipalpis TaxID=7200 RepID=A0A7G3AL11_LUTLO
MSTAGRVVVGQIVGWCILLQILWVSNATHLTGTFDPSKDFFKFLIKFGFQKTERHSQRDSYGYIYGNITAKDSYFPVNLTLAVLDKYTFLDGFYGNRTLQDREAACQRMFGTLDRIAYNAQCNPHAKVDYLRQIPCRRGQLCWDEDSPSNVVSGSQFTYVISDLMQPSWCSTMSTAGRVVVGQIVGWCILLQILWVSNATHLTGTFDPSKDFFKFLIKFGFQKTERHSQRDSYGYIYGNITAKDSYFPVNLTLAVLDKYTFLDGFYGNRTLQDREAACQRMFGTLDRIAYNAQCNPHAKVDYLRQIPCRRGQLCWDEDSPSNVVSGSQFTYVISDLMQPRFWYVSLVACYRNTTTCRWHHYDPRKFDHAPEISYDIRLVNGNPNQSAYIPLTLHFSFDRQNTLEMYLSFFVVYLVLVPMQVHAMRRQNHPVTRLFTASLFLEFISLCLILVHMIRFAMNGVGNENFATAGEILDIFSRTLFMLILLLLAKGWAVTRQQISRTGWIILMTIWIPYCALNVMLYVWNRTEVDIISDIDEYQTWPGWIVLVCRSCIMLWFLWELRSTMRYEHSTKKLDFLLHFGASSLVWFIYLPVVALVALQVSPLWRYKLLLGITNSADCLAFCVMTGLLWPNRAGQYLLLAGNFSGMDELDEFNEAPHIVHGETFLPTNPPESIQGESVSDSGVDTHLAVDLENGSMPVDGYEHVSLANGDVSTDLLSGDDIMRPPESRVLRLNGDAIRLHRNGTRMA